MPPLLLSQASAAAAAAQQCTLPSTPSNSSLPFPSLVPFPAGGYLVFQFLEAIRGGKKVDEGLEKGIMASGFLLLTSVGLFLIVRDVVNIGSRFL